MDSNIFLLRLKWFLKVYNTPMKSFLCKLNKYTSVVAMHVADLIGLILDSTNNAFSPIDYPSDISLIKVPK